MTDSKAGITGTVHAVLTDEHGKIQAEGTVHNLVPAVSDQYSAGRRTLPPGLPAQVTGFKLGAGATAVAKTGAGAALVTYLAGSNKANDATFPTAVAGVVTWKRTYAAGEATTASPITEVVLVT